MNSTVWPKTLQAAIALLGLCCLCGCTGGSSTESASLNEEEQVKPSEKLITDPQGLLADVPVPLGAHFKSGSSKSYQTGSRRRVDYRYGIWAEKSLLRVFYRENMPVHGWKLTNSIQTGSAHHLSYKKGRETCRVSIGPVNWSFQTVIEIIIQPVDTAG